MKTLELQNNCLLVDTELLEFKVCHPKQVISTEIPIPIWRYEYSYKTNRGNSKTAIKYIIREESDWDVVDIEFNNYIKKFNDKNPERKLSNVEILDAEFMGKVYLELE